MAAQKRHSRSVLIVEVLDPIADDFFFPDVLEIIKTLGALISF